MKAKTLCLLAGTAVPLILTGSAHAGFLGIKVVGKPNEFGLIVCNIYAVFDRPPTPDPDNPGEFIIHDLIKAVAGTANSPLLIQVEGGGTFFNGPFTSGHLAPQTLTIAAFPIAAFDSFVGFGVKQINTPTIAGGLGKAGPGANVNDTTITPGLPAISGSQFATTVAAWAIVPDSPQANPFDPINVSGNGQILIAQFSTADGTGFSGTMLVGYISNDLVGFEVVSFYHVPGPGALWLLGAAGLLGSRRRRCSGRGFGIGRDWRRVGHWSYSK